MNQPTYLPIDTYDYRTLTQQLERCAYTCVHDRTLILIMHTNISPLDLERMGNII